MSLFFRRLRALWVSCIGLGVIIRWVLNPPFSPHWTTWTLPNIFLLFCGAISFTIGIYLLYPLYKFPEGILINPPWVAKFYDFISVIFGSAAAILVTDSLLLKIFKVSSIMNDDYLTFMSIFFYIIGIPMLAAFTGRLTYQAIRVDEDGVYIHTDTETEIILWKDIVSMELSKEYVMVGRMDISVPRELQKRLKINTTMGESYFVNEPQLKRKKEEVIRQFKLYMPEQIRDLNMSVLDQW